MWYLSKKEIEDYSPSRMDGIDLKTENYLRGSYCAFLQELGMRIKVPQDAIATAMVFCHRFYTYQSHSRNDRFLVATICMFLAIKVEENPRRLEDVIKISFELQRKRNSDLSKALSDSEYSSTRELVLAGERFLMSILSFELSVNTPHKILRSNLKKLGILNQSLSQAAWNFINDGLRTTLCLQYSGDVIAAGAIHLATEFLEIELPQDWYLNFQGLTHDMLIEVSNQMLDLYEAANAEAEKDSVEERSFTQEDKLSAQEAESTNNRQLADSEEESTEMRI